ncbi:tetratricopeptide repeat-containing hybrid sensor histidine kinase/response regulator [Flavobacterium ardleyense]|uniref:tetratricopeptide repeat-containing hybrid sensor histidine kinase/response regulator n=1 Tax=Flavobacterium ardleyense TaxID=2038737 RepID=UPI00298C5702|nr:ATP-binding protein [Flavobacterium ardleyense]
MRFWQYSLLLFSILTFSQPKAEKLDSVATYLQIAAFDIKTNNYIAALDHTQKAINYAEAKNDIDNQAKSYTLLGDLYFQIKKYEDAFDGYAHASKLYAILPASSNQALVYYKIGLCYMQKKQYSMAEKSFNTAKEIYQSISYLDAIELLELQKGILYRTNGKVEEAAQIFTSLLAKTEKEDVYNIRAEALYELGTIELDKKRSNLAINYLDRAAIFNKKNFNQDLQSNIFLALSTAHENIGQNTKAFAYLKEHLELRNNISLINNKRLGQAEYNKFKESEKLKTIEQMHLENEQQKKSNRFSKVISILAIALISILSLLSLSLYKNNIIRNHSNQLLKDKNNELQAAKDKAEKASKARTEFLSTVSHELRTPLNAINGITHLLITEEPKKDQLKYLNALKFSGNYLLTFINEILEINRIDSGTVIPEKIAFNLRQLLENIHSSMSELAIDNNNLFVLEIDSEVPDNLLGDPTKLSQIFINLINNALKFTSDGSVKVIAKREMADEGTVLINFKVIDTGIGIAKEKQSAIFDSFAQGSIEINRKYGGTGLGLNIVKKLIKMMGGKISLESEIGQGSTFSFTINFDQGSEVSRQSEYSYNDDVFVNKKILLVEDNKINQMITEKLLQNKQIICDTIDNGEEAIEIIRDKTYDLVLMDIHLPGINGTIATQMIREFDSHTPIIALTAISLNENRDMLLSYGMTDVITKPFDPENFYKILSQNL